MTRIEAEDAIEHQRMVGLRIGNDVVVGWIRTVLRDDCAVIWTTTGQRIEVPLAEVQRVTTDTLGGFEE
jgi:hypothetical protein